MNQAAVKRFLTIMLCFVASLSFCQPGTTIDLDKAKPKQYQNRILASEKTGEKKFGFKRRFFQNMFTHYNYYFNANQRLNDIVDRAKQNFRDDYTQLLPFYNYSLDVTAQDGDMDSVIYKCNAGILLHDLRNDWVDNMYFIMGKAYYYRKNFDSAAQVFQYINYAFAPRDEDGYFIPIGSNESQTNGVFTVSTKENRNIIQKATTQPPSRNDALLWQAKNFTESGRYGEAAGILQILKSDPQFPERLHEELQETIAYWCYRQNMYDSAATYLSRAVNNVPNREEKARREFLVAQLFLLSKNDSAAINWYDKAAEHTLNPIMEVYANLNSINAYGNKTNEILQQKIDNLTKLAHRDKYVTNRDIIYYAIAQVQIQKGDKTAAIEALKKSIGSSISNPQQKSLSFLMLADISYDAGQYVKAKNYYDSTSVSYLTEDADKNRLEQRTTALKTIAQGLADIHAEDSVQLIAAMPKAQQEAVVKKMVKQLRKLQGLKEDENSQPFVNAAVKGQASIASDMFASSSSGSSTDWYFNNANLKGQGFSTFRQQWGSRPNIDNWRRQSAVDKALATIIAQQRNKADSLANVGNTPNAADTAGNMSMFDALLANLPTTPEKLKTSNDKIAKALFTNAQAFQNKLEDYPAAITNYDTLNIKYPGNNFEEEALFNLYYCYTKLGKKAQADSVKAILNTKFAKGKFTNTLLTGPAATAKKPDPATEKYQEIYNLFVEGKFDEAKRQKASADSIYSNSHWTPQLLFIEAVYYVSRKEDSAAINRLNDLAKMFPSSPMAARANTMISVLQRRKEIEQYLTQLQITRYKDSDVVSPVIVTTPTTTITTEKPVFIKPDSVAKPITPPKLLQADTVKTLTTTAKNFVFNAAEPQFVTIVLDKVDAVFVNEASNSFNRFNMTNFYRMQLKVSSAKIDDRFNVVLIGPFKDAAAAVDYVTKVKPVTGARILPWLTANKYGFTIISDSNLALMKENKDVEGYKDLMNKTLPGTF